MAAQFAAVRECYAIGPDDRLVAAFAPFALYGPALGIPVAVPDCDITKPATLRAEALADACAAVDATIVFAAPAALDGVLASRRELCRRRARRRSAALRLVLSAGAPVPQRDRSRRSAASHPRAELHTPYGMTEVLSVADIDLETLAAVGPGRGVCVGRAARRGRAPDRAARRAATARAARSSSARPGCRSATTASGRRTTARGRSTSTAVEWHRTGDVGHLDADGRLWVEGRLAHVVETVDGPGDAGAARDRRHGGDRAALRRDGVGPAGCEQVVVVVEREGKAGLAAA